ncbi:MAG: DUF1993 domain-containing protein [Pseudobdellovibrio sp.]
MNKHVTMQFIKMLTNLDGLLVKATAHADAKKFDVNNLLNERIIADMLPLGKQIQIACDNVKTCVTLLSHTETPKFEDNEKTVAEYRTRIQKTIDLLKTKIEADYSKYKEAKYSPVWMQGAYLTGEDYFNEYIFPNFYFHVTTAYDILRKAGVEIGKSDYMGTLNFHK